MALRAASDSELRAEATMMGTSLHTLVQMVDNGLGLTLLPEMAIRGGTAHLTHNFMQPYAIWLEDTFTAQNIPQQISCARSIESC